MALPRSVCRVISVIAITLGVALGCGGSATSNFDSTQPTKAVVKVSMTGTLPAGSLIGGIDLTAMLAPGVSLKSTSNPPETDADVIVASGVASTNSQLLSTYTPPSGSTKGSARLFVINAGGFGTGEFATVTGDIAAGYQPTSSDFSAASLTVTDLNGTPLSGMTAEFTVSNQ
jgi:hypothetical protein